MSDRDTISSARTNFINAFNNQNADSMAAALSDDHASMPPNRPTLRGKDEARAFWLEGWAQAASNMTTHSEELKIVSDLAVDEFQWVMESTPRTGSAPVRDEGKCIWLWRRQSNGDWKLARSIWNSDLAAA